jgi:hypothetical protein
LVGLEPSKSKIISIQYQQLDIVTGHPIGKLIVLKEWTDGPEYRMLEEFKHIYLDNGVWGFIPVGNNLLFECKFLKHKLREYFNLDGLRLGHRPMIDLKHTLVMMNSGRFKNYSILVGKTHEATNMALWYSQKNYEQIERYITKEAADFVSAYIVLKRELPRIKLDFSCM